MTARAPTPRVRILATDPQLAAPHFLDIATRILTEMPRSCALHLRARTLPAADLFAIAERLRTACPAAVIVVHDRIDIAAAAGVMGVQLGAQSLPIAHARAILGAAATIGYSAHEPEEAAQAEADGANHLLAGTIFQSESHPETQPAGTRLIAETAARCRIPVFAIGGVTAGRLAEVHAAGAYGVAVISAVWTGPDPVHAARELVKLAAATWSRE